MRRWTRVWHLLRDAAWELWRNRLATMGAVMVLIVFLVALLAPCIARYDPVKQNYREMLQGPSAAHYFGTDKFGRDVWSRVVWGAQRSVLISVLAVMVGLLCGVPLGTISGFYGGKLDAIYYTFGDNDVILLLDMPDNATVAAFAITAASTGLVRVKTTPLLTVEDVDKAVGKSVQYRAPGR